MRSGWAAPALIAVLLSSCGKPDAPASPPLYQVEAGRSARPETITVLLPGALTTADIFRPAQDWVTPDHLVVEYRLPGMQGEPVLPPLDLDRSAGWVADLANRYPDAEIQLIGYSTGAAIAIEAAGRIEHSERVKVAAISSATPFPGAVLAAIRGGLDVAGIAIRIGSLDRQRIWEDYYKTLYLGKGWRRSAAKREQAERLEDILKGRVVAPGGGVGKAQSGSLLFWSPSDAALSSRAEIRFYHGDLDPVFPLPTARRLASRLHSTICILPGQGHLVLQSDPELMERIATFLGGNGGNGPCG
ncbi:alpha/beta hydrolase [Tabrizicola sp.]|jgi:pimeloyl-ACP methyl ester carboxylesterase|uniref:alpha/beta fold hydrolase n=1 Tax=Tabrizicola sp. TaxID=2005166 RepID=UPI001A5CF210|nr:alpha/beta hydrolase [Tabrizicola sp.]MBL9062181.1 alpha/beta hydrolase [Tabrizicola sp.]